MKRKAVALLSGGLDSMLAVRLLLDQGIPVAAIRFITHFGCDPVSAGSCGHDVEPLVKLWGHLGLEVKMAHLGQEYIEMVKNPPHGRGKNMNPCVDCRIMMLDWSREFMDRHEGGFLVTGEVLNQRPMSQTLARFHEIDNQLGLKGRVLRPLSAKLLPPTIPEIEGLVDRSRLLDISGRGRTRQYELARRWGIEDVPQPSGGCLLTDPGYSARLRDLWDHDPDGEVRDLNFLRVGRHFRASERCKIIVGRNERENAMIEAFAAPEDVLVRARDHVGPVTILRGEVDDPAVRQAAMLTARYADIPDGDFLIAVTAGPKGGASRTLFVTPAEDETFRPMRVGLR
ncbi:MAG: tRNA (5-methylaminomethyl-2-thiouridylate)-methyltransferase [Planctomycetes bacterium]|nr:tRNA (5-methylaminomethyl-2-thiouridylate)-methyltransferase [Planctomycetota bacterium]